MIDVMHMSLFSFWNSSCSRNSRNRLEASGRTTRQHMLQNPNYGFSL